ncbi:MAG: DUF167 domain-containing protein [Planctomycetes bacterium]|nr:DUF167 domain-containing protein [Planctomycetota bacterium]
MNQIDKLAIRDIAGGAVLSVKAVPGSSRDRIAGALGDCLKIAVCAPAEKGKANAAIAELLAKSLGLKKNAVKLLYGQTSARKEFAVAGLNADEIRRRLVN